jgi:hypothetical protein
MKPSDPPKGKSVTECAGAIADANVASCDVVAAACVSGRTHTAMVDIIGNRIMLKAREATDAALGERMADKTTWADVRTMLIGFHKACLEELEAANK